MSKARQETTRALKHGKVALREGFLCVFGRFTRDDTYRSRMIWNGVSYETMQAWDKIFADREVAPLPLDAVPYHARKRQYARWENRSTQRGGSDTAPHAWNDKRTSQGEEEHDGHQEYDAALDGWSWTQSSSWWTPANQGAGATPATQVHIGMGRCAGHPPRLGLSGGSRLTRVRFHDSSGEYSPMCFESISSARGVRTHCE